MSEELARRTWMVLAGASTLLAVALAVRAGAPLLGGDGPAYVSAAENLWEEGLSGIPRAYPGFVAILSLILKVDASLHALVGVQIAMNVLGGYCVFRLGRELGGPLAGLVASALFMLNPDILRWTGYVLTDSLFISLVPIAVWLVWRAREGSTATRLVAIVGMIGVASIRPTGWLLLPVLGSFLFLERMDSWSKKVVLVAFVSLAFAVLLFFAVNPTLRLNAADPVYKLSHGVVIPGYPSGWLSMPDGSSYQEGLWSSIEYVLDHPVSVARLASVRVITEFALVRPFYSVAHNLFLVAWGGVTYVLFVLGLRRAKRGGLLRLLLVTIGTLVAFVAMTFASYDGRFALYPISLVSVVAGCSLGRREREAPSTSVA